MSNNFSQIQNNLFQFYNKENLIRLLSVTFKCKINLEGALCFTPKNQFNVPAVNKQELRILFKFILLSFKRE